MIDKIEPSEEDEHIKKPRSWLERLSAILAREPQDREELREVLRDAEDRDVLSGEMLGMIERILQVSEMQVREVMVPRAQLISVKKTNKLEELLPIISESGHSRFPVFAENNPNEIIGILLAKDLLKYFFTNNAVQFNIHDVIRPVMFVPQSKRLDVLLREFRAKRNHIAIVLDEYGHIAGLITIEDVLEQIVGDIEDEYDIEEEDGHIKKLPDGSFIVKASTPIEEFNEYFQANFSDEEFDTIGGIVLQGFKHLPKRNESIKLEGFKFKVLNSDNRRVYLLEVKVVKKK